VSFIQRLMTAILPRSWEASMEADSRAWMASCETCGYERSLWDMGGIRWKAVGNSRTRHRCPACGRARWHRLHKVERA
jgi:hypothetical protein